MKKHVLLVTIGFSPNVGGIETHFDDLVKGLVKRRWFVSVLTYQPLTSTVSARFIEKKANISIYRMPLLRGLFYKLIHSPILEFLYLTPGLFFSLPVVLLTSKIDVIHSHGLVAGFASVFWGKLFRKRVISTTHSLYEFPDKGMYRSFAKWIFSNSDTVLCLSNQSCQEIIDLGVKKEKVVRFVYWIDANRFQRILDAKRQLELSNSFVCLFVGRLMREKGILELLQSTKLWPKNTKLLIAGIGPMEKEVQKYSKKYLEKIMYLGKVSQERLPLYYSAADLFIIPSINEEGFGRVILEALLSGTPVVGSNKGAIPEAMDESVGTLIQPSPKEISKAVRLYVNSKVLWSKKHKAARPFALKRYSESNINTIIRSYDPIA